MCQHFDRWGRYDVQKCEPIKRALADIVTPRPLQQLTPMEIQQALASYGREWPGTVQPAFPRRRGIDF